MISLFMYFADGMKSHDFFMWLKSSGGVPPPILTSSGRVITRSSCDLVVVPGLRGYKREPGVILVDLIFKKFVTSPSVVGHNFEFGHGGVLPKAVSSTPPPLPPLLKT